MGNVCSANLGQVYGHPCCGKGEGTAMRIHPKAVPEDGACVVSSRWIVDL
jgi:hypothetical protein